MSVNLNYLNKQITKNWQQFLRHFEVEEYKENSKMIAGVCPVHGGDNPTAFNWYVHKGGGWKCYTHACEKHFYSTPLGLVRGLLSRQKHDWNHEEDNSSSLGEAIYFTLSFLKINNKKISSQPKNNDKKNFALHEKQHKEKNMIKKIERSFIRQSLQIPADYYLKRGYSAKILDKFDVGLCCNSQKPMYNRVVVPIYEDSGQYAIGFSGRSIFEKCNLCNSYHNPKGACPSEKNGKTAKWIHSYGFKTQNNLYNIWNAADEIYQTKTAILVEGPGDVWRLAEADIHNSLAILGTNFGKQQRILLDGLGAYSLLIIMDGDVNGVGRKAAQRIKKQCGRAYDVTIVEMDDHTDVGDMTTEQINKKIKPLLKIEEKKYR